MVSSDLVSILGAANSLREAHVAQSAPSLTEDGSDVAPGSGQRETAHADADIWPTI